MRRWRAPGALLAVAVRGLRPLRLRPRRRPPPPPRRRRRPRRRTTTPRSRLLAEADRADLPALDAAGVKRMLLSLERRISRNALLRAKHADEPAKFLESEVELDAELRALRALAAAPEQYGVLVASDSLRSLLALLAHENSDIAIGVVALLAELLSEEALAVGPGGGAAAAEEEDGGDGNAAAPAQQVRRARVTLQPSWFPEAGAPVGAPAGPAGANAPAPANAADAAVLGSLRFYARMRGAAYLLYTWFWTALAVIGGGLATLIFAAGVGASVAARAYAGADPGVGIPFPAAFAEAIQAALAPPPPPTRRVAAPGTDDREPEPHLDTPLPPLPIEDLTVAAAAAAARLHVG